jgi:hypothetical protein
MMGFIATDLCHLAIICIQIALTEITEYDLTLIKVKTKESTL